jgi:hypothetical protein
MWPTAPLSTGPLSSPPSPKERQPPGVLRARNVLYHPRRLTARPLTHCPWGRPRQPPLVRISHGIVIVPTRHPTLPSDPRRLRAPCRPDRSAAGSGNREWRPPAQTARLGERIVSAPRHGAVADRKRPTRDAGVYGEMPSRHLPCSFVELRISISPRPAPLASRCGRARAFGRARAPPRTTEAARLVSHLSYPRVNLTAAHPNQRARTQNPFSPFSLRMARIGNTNHHLGGP